jgi:hypothetical protein
MKQNMVEMILNFVICHLYNTNIESAKNIEWDAKHVLRLQGIS